MSEFVFILGAGFSRWAGAPLMADFLEAAERTVGESPSFKAVAKAISELQIAHSKADLDLYNIEPVFGIFEMARLIGTTSPDSLHSREVVADLILALKETIAATLEGTVRFPINNTALNHYEKFVNLLCAANESSPHGYRCSIITFNYDLILDHALTVRGCGYDYCLVGQRPRSMPLLKLHGSLNWASCAECKQIVPWEIGPYLNKPRMYTPGTTSIPLRMASQLKSSGLSHCTGAVTPVPVIVPPSWNKMEYHESLASVWHQAALELSDAEKIFVIGYSLPETDSFFRYLYALGAIGDRLIKRFCVFHPDASTKGRFDQLLGKAAATRFQFRPLGFPDCLSEIAGEVGVRS